MNDDAFISMQALGKRFGPVRAVDDVSLDIRRGEFFGLLGPSGCGKTTLLRMLAGFESPSSGEIYIDGQPCATVPPYQRPVNMVFQNYAIFPHLDVFRNIAFGLRKERLGRTELAARVNEALALIKLEGYGTRRADELSGGQRQRVALARALIKRPKVLLLDEPLGALDKKLREQMQIELRQLQKSVGITFVFVTHDQEEALTMSDRLAVMSEGRVLEVGAPDALYERPETRFVADFLGTMNFFPARVRSREGTRLCVDAERLGRIEVAAGEREFAAGDAVVLGIRPENIRMRAGRPEPAPNMVYGELSDAAYLGDRAHLYVRTPGAEQPVLVAMQNLDGAASTATHGERAVALQWSERSVLLLRGD